MSFTCVFGLSSVGLEEGAMGAMGASSWATGTRKWAVCVNKRTVHVFDASCKSGRRTDIPYYQK